jgi:hypothetical protein
MSLAGFALASLFLAQGATTGPTGGAVTGAVSGSFFALSVADVASQSLWYQEKLGFHVLSQGEAPNKIAKFALLEGNGTIVELIQHSKAKPRAVAAPTVGSAHEIHGIFKVGMVVADIDAVYKGLKLRGVPIAYDLMPTKDVPLRSFSVRDGEGNLLQFFGK